MDHVHVSLFTALVTFANVLVIGMIWRALAYRLAERGSTVGKAMAFVY
jgi:hypothetical protein